MNNLLSADSFQVVVWVLMGALVVLMVVMSVIPQRKQKKRMMEMMQSLAIGDNVMTIGGFIGKVVGINEDKYTLNIGTESEPVHVVVIKNAIRTKLDANGNVPNFTAQRQVPPTAPAKEEEKSDDTF
ncbi:MAG: preprotein translocase subunit YajC [Firmicutes bacterium]|nr:preprotein translocase subunit YajC [Bacillota bacterium]